MRPLITAFLLVVLFVPTVFAATTGTINGVVRDREGNPLPGATVFVEGTRLGVIANEQGRFFVLNVPAGKYNVRAKLVGYRDFVLANVEVRPDFATEVAINMATEAMELTEVVVEAGRPLIQEDATGTTRFISGDEIKKLPVRGYRDAAAQQTGIVNFQRQIDRETQNQNTLIVRGGRPNETAYYVDGFSQQDPLTGTTSTSISSNAIEEVVVLTGGFNPEYGRIMSGVVNVVTREGAKKYFGAVEAVSDVLSGDWLGAPRADYNVYDMSLGGPLVPSRDDITFYVSGERRWQRDRNPSIIPGNVQAEYDAIGLDPDFKPQNANSGWNWQGKLAWRLTDAMNLKVGTLGSQEEWREYLHSYLYNLQHTPEYYDKNQSYFANMNYAASKNTFYNLGGTYFQTQRKRGDGLAFDDLNPQYVVAGAGQGGELDTLASENGQFVTPGGYYRTSNPDFDERLGVFWDEGHVFDDYLQRKSNYWGLLGGMTSQLNQYHQLKGGGDYQRHEIRFFNHLFPTDLGGPNINLDDYDAYGYDLDVGYRDVVVRNLIDDDNDGVFDDTTYATRQVADRVGVVDADDGRDGAKHPQTFSLFVQDKYEREGVIVNGGLRLDHLDVNTPALKDEDFPLGDPATDDLPSVLEDDELEDNKTYTRLSPRLGVAFPVDEKTLLRFNYGQFFQQPNLQDLYVSYRFLEYKVRTGGYFAPFGNPNLRPERTTAYEVGAARQLGDHIRIDATLYWKDVKDLVQVQNVPSKPTAFSSFRNTDFATVKGVDVGFLMRPVNHISMQVNYSLAYANGTGSVSLTQRNQAWTADETPKQTAPLDFDQRHKFAANLDWRFGENEGPAWGGTQWLENFGANVLLNLASGTPYTPSVVYNEVFLASLAPTAESRLNSRNGPWVIQLDLKVDKGFRLGAWNLNAYVWGLNMLDRDNPVNVYTSSGTAQTTNFLNTTDGEQFLDSAAASGVDGESLYRLSENNPNFYATPRQVRFGVRAAF
jgi:outer membrane receptor protein involved in Fe transport